MNKEFLIPIIIAMAILILFPLLIIVMSACGYIGKVWAMRFLFKNKNK